MAQRNSEKETDEPIEEIVEVVSEKKELVKEGPIIDDSTIYNAEVINRFGKTAVGSKIEKKGSIIKVLLDKKLIKLI